MIREILYAPIRLILGLANVMAFSLTIVFEALLEIWALASGMFKVASATEAAVSTYEPSMWRSLWNDLFSQV